MNDARLVAQLCQLRRANAQVVEALQVVLDELDRLPAEQAESARRAAYAAWIRARSAAGGWAAREGT